MPNDSKEAGKGDAPRPYKPSKYGERFDEIAWQDSQYDRLKNAGEPISRTDRQIRHEQQRRGE